MTRTTPQELVRRAKLIHREFEAAIDRFRQELTQVEPVETLGFESTTAEESGRSRLLRAGLEAYDRIRRGEADRITPEQEHGFEAIVRLSGRPALILENDEFQDPPPEWRHLLNPHRAQIREVARRVARVEVTRDGKRTWFGTAFVVGPQIVMTNTHVVTQFAAKNRQGNWQCNDRTAVAVDFNKELRAHEPREFVVEEIIGTYPLDDLALLRVAATSTADLPLPEPLPVAANRPDGAERPVYVIGHPSADAERNPPRAMYQVFGGVYQVKRLLPGKAYYSPALPDRLDHDCSTLGGNSGSPVVDLETHAVLGLHYGGTSELMNYAIPLWQLSDDPLLRRGAVNFV